MNLGVFVGFLCFKLVWSYFGVKNHPCTDAQDIPHEVTTGREIQKGWYCYRNFGVIPHAPFNGQPKEVAEDYCVSWYPWGDKRQQGHLISLHSPEEDHWFATTPALFGTIPRWVGLEKIACPACCTKSSECRWTDGVPLDSTEYGVTKHTQAQPYGYDVVCGDGWLGCFYITDANVWQQDGCLTKAGCNPWDVATVCKFKIPTCGGKKMDDAGICSGHGFCLEEEKCHCETDYFGSECQYIRKCNGVRADNENVCSGRGNCTHQDNCVCEKGYNGPSCEISNPGMCFEEGDIYRNGYCYKFFATGTNWADSEAVCQNWDSKGHLLNIHSPTDEYYFKSIITKEGWLGMKKHEYAYRTNPCPLGAYGYVNSDGSETGYPEAKGTSVLCDKDDRCFKFTKGYFWEDVSCDRTDLEVICQYKVPVCRGADGHSNETVCRGHGKCAKDGECSCHDPYFGNDCEYHRCFGVREDSDDVCDGRGKCVDPDVCVCEDGFWGLNCNYTTCNKIQNNYIGDTTSHVCTGHGKCVAKDDCDCHWDWGGQYCQWTYPCHQTGDIIYKHPQNWQSYYVDSPPGPGVPFTYNPPSLYNNICYHKWRDNTHAKLWVDAEKHCSTVFFNEKGTQASLHSPEEEHWLWNVKAPGDGSGQSTWMGLQKVNPCNRVKGAGGGCKLTDPKTMDTFEWTDGTDVWYVNDIAEEILCDELVKCFRQYRDRPWDNTNDVPLPWPAASHHSSLYDETCAREMYDIMCTYYLHHCNGKREERKDVCNGNGFCFEDGVCTCKGKGYPLPWCGVTSCEGILSNETKTVCAGHGDCLSKDYCKCHEGYLGVGCNITSCNGRLTNETNLRGVCSNKGKCEKYNECKCDDDYFGGDCELTYCGYVRSDNDKEVCRGHGKCWPLNWCLCDSTSYSGPNCEVWKCNGVASRSPIVCHGGGICSEINKCDCDENHFGEWCEITYCETNDGKFVLSNDTEKRFCGGRGECVQLHTCKCEEGYFGQKCELTTCKSIPNTDNATCSGHGTCESYDKCVDCEGNYWGEFCEITLCGNPPKMSNDSDVCEGLDRSVCFPENVCNCRKGFFGDHCGITTCKGINSTKKTEVCGGRGDCWPKDTCECTGEYKGKWDPKQFCEERLCYGKAWNDEDNVCAGHGTCNNDHTCTCSTTPKYYGNQCWEYFQKMRVLYAQEEVNVTVDETRRAKVVLKTIRKIIFTPYVVPVSVIAEGLDTEVDCKDIFLECQKNEKVGDWFGEKPKCKFVAKDDFTTSIELIFDDDAPRMIAAQLYSVKFALQDARSDGSEDTFYWINFVSPTTEPLGRDTNNDGNDGDDGTDPQAVVGGIVGGFVGGIALIICCLVCILIICVLGFFAFDHYKNKHNSGMSLDDLQKKYAMESNSFSETEVAQMKANWNATDGEGAGPGEEGDGEAEEFRLLEELKTKYSSMTKANWEEQQAMMKEDEKEEETSGPTITSSSGGNYEKDNDFGY